MNSLRKGARESSKDLSETLVAVAVELLRQERQLRLPTMREIAARAGVAPGAAYRHFASQGDLFLAVITRLFHDLEVAVTSSLMANATSLENVRNFARAYVHWGTTNPGSYQLLFETTDDESLLARGQRPGLGMVEQLTILVADACPDTPSPLNLTVTFWMALHGLTSLRMHKSGMPWPQSVEEDVDDLVSTFISTQ